MNKKGYSFGLLLYKDSLIYDYGKIIKYIEKEWKQYAYITHKPDSEEKKEHVHVLVHFPNKRYISAISKELGIPKNYIQIVNLIPYLRYLIHLDDEEKIQYSVQEVHGSLKQRLIDILNTNNISETEQVSMIGSFIFEYDGWLSNSIVFQYVIKNGLYSAYRRNFSLFRELVLEHNSNM